MPTNDISHDEIRRQLADSHDEHQAVLPQWRRALDRVFDPSTGASGSEKQAVLGLPDRRSFFRIGGMTIAATAVIASCSRKKAGNVAQTGTTPSTSASTTTTNPGSQVTDVTLLRTAQSIEILAVETYQQAIDSGLLTTAAVLDAAKLFQSQHRDHAGLLAATVRTAGGTPYDQANAYLKSTVVDAAVAALTDQESVIKLALELENTAAQTYTYSGGVLTTPELRQTLMSIGGVEARHMSVLYGALQSPQVPLPLMPTRDAVPVKGHIAPEGTPTPTTPPSTSAPRTTTTTAATGSGGTGSSTTATATK